MMRMRVLAVGAVLMLASCAAHARVYSFGAERLNPEVWFRQLHRDMERCLGARRDYGRIEWLVAREGVMGEAGEVAEGGTVAGKWSRPNRIYLDARYVMHPGVIKHELGHYIKQQGDPLHDDPLFQMCVSL